MDTTWIQMVLGLVGTMAIGVATNMLTPVVRRSFARAARRSRSLPGRVMRASALRRVLRRAANPMRRLAASVRT
jgi:hypothetical protein